MALTTTRSRKKENRNMPLLGWTDRGGGGRVVFIPCPVLSALVTKLFLFLTMMTMIAPGFLVLLCRGGGLGTMAAAADRGAPPTRARRQPPGRHGGSPPSSSSMPETESAPPGPTGPAVERRPPTPPMLHQAFAFGAAFGDNMVLQRGPTSRAAVYGFLDFAAPPWRPGDGDHDGPSRDGRGGADGGGGGGEAATAVEVTVTVSIHDAGDTGGANGDAAPPLHTAGAVTGIDATRQPFGSGPEWGARPCDEATCPPHGMKAFNPWNRPPPTWKALFPPMEAGGNYTIVAECRSVGGGGGTGSGDARRISITNVTFGDVWYCSGQSNMKLPVANSFSRNETVRAILNEGKYRNLRIMAGSSDNHPHGGSGPDFHHDDYNGDGGGGAGMMGDAFNPGYGGRNGSNPWMTSLQAVSDGNETHPTYSLFQFGATCWYFGQRLSELMGTDGIPIGLANTAVGGQRIEEYMDNSTVGRCTDRAGMDLPYWNGQLFATQVLPFVDMTVRGWVWYQGENNMYWTKGNSAADVGYGCEMRELIAGWRRAWSEREPNTTDPLAPFGVVTLASGGSEGGPNMGAMRQAQTANHGVLPNDLLPNTFLAQAYDLDDEWGTGAGPCLGPPWHCCRGGGDGGWDGHDTGGVDSNGTDTCNATIAARCKPACDAAAGTPTHLGPIHPRSKKAVGDRLGTAAFNSGYGGAGAYTGPTLAGCTVMDNPDMDGKGVLEVRFDEALLRGDVVELNKIPPITPHPRGAHLPSSGGSQLYVQTDASEFCIEPIKVIPTGGRRGGGHDTRTYCPTWAGGDGLPELDGGGKHLDGGWINLNFTLSPTMSSILVDLSPLPEGAVPTAVRYGWGIIDCCDYTDPDLYITHGCLAACPIMGAPSNLPANPFQAKIVGGECSCVAPQVCSSKSKEDDVEK